MTPEHERWKRFANPWRTLGPHMAAAIRAAANGEPMLVSTIHATRTNRPGRKPGKYKRALPADGFSGSALRRRRKAEGYSQSGLAYLVGTTRARISSWELGISVPPSDRVAALAQLLNCRPADLCAGKVEALA